MRNEDEKINGEEEIKTRCWESASEGGGRGGGVVSIFHIPRVREEMEAQQVLRMNGGEGQNSYGKNSLYQRASIYKTKPLIESAIQEIMSTFKQPKRLNIADLGCSTGPNSLLPTTIIIDATHEICQRTCCTFPEIQVFLNDLPQNDFNSVFMTIPPFYKKLNEEKGLGFGTCFVSAVPGSFHGRLFPKQSMHFIYSANALHYCSQVPPLLKGEMGGVNKGNIMLGITSPHIVFEAYLAQFQRDLTDFLKSRSEEIVAGGHMILHLLGREILNPFAEAHSVWDDLSRALSDLVDEGLVEEEKFNSFNIPIYEPHRDEVEEVIKSEGSFRVIQFKTAQWWSKSNVVPKWINPEFQVGIARSAFEPILASHFGQMIMDELFKKFKGHVNQGGFQDRAFHLISLVRKE